MLNFINRKETIHTGGGCMVDLLYLKDGRVICVSADIIILYPSIEALFQENTGDEDYPCIELY